MEEQDLDYFKKLILKHLVDIDSEIEKLVELSKPVAPDNAIGRLTRMEAINERSIHEANLRKTKLRKDRLKDALHRIEKDEDYGHCKVCEEEIARKRLESLPESHICVSCLQKIEDA